MKLILAILLIVNLSGSPVANAAGIQEKKTTPYPVRMTPIAGLKAIGQLDAALDKPFKETIYMEGNNTKAFPVETPRKYLVKASQGFFVAPPQGVYSSQEEHSLFLQLMQQAKPSTTSFLKDFDFSKADILSVIPITIHPKWSDYQDAITWGDYYAIMTTKERQKAPRYIQGFPDATISHQDHWRLEVVSNYKHDEYANETDTFSLKLMAWGDFNEDGIEDVLISYFYAALPGTMRIQCVDAFTRLSAEGPLVQLDNLP